MTRIIAIALMLTALLATRSDAQIMQLGYGASSSPGAVTANCGVGIADLSTGCVQPMLGGL
jgi:hypothetical protein